MATFDYYARLNGPAKRNMIWGECIHFEDRDHMNHSLNTTKKDFYSVDGVEVGKNDFYAPTLKWIRNKYYMAAGDPTELVKLARKNKRNPYSELPRTMSADYVIETTATNPIPNNTMGFLKSKKGMPRDPVNFSKHQLAYRGRINEKRKTGPVEVISARSQSCYSTPRNDNYSARSNQSNNLSARAR